MSDMVAETMFVENSFYLPIIIAGLKTYFFFCKTVVKLIIAEKHDVY
jgi:hypothetical protein